MHYTVFWTELTQPSVVCMFYTSIRSVSVRSLNVGCRSSPKAGHSASLIYKAEIVCLCVCVCVFAITACFLFNRPQTRCGYWEHRGSGYSGVHIPHLAFRRELVVHFRCFLRRRWPFSNYCSLHFRFLRDLICCHPTFEFKLMIINF